MIAKLKNIFRDELIFDTAIVFIGTSLGGFFNLLYHLISVRLLSPQDYGTFNALISLIMFTSIAVSPLSPTLVRFFTEYITKKDYFTFFSVLEKIIVRLFIIAIMIFVAIFIFARVIADFLNSPSVYIVLCGGIISLSLLSIIWPVLFQSFQKFKTYSFLGITSSLSKLIIGALLIYAGFKVKGALVGFMVAPVIIFVLSLPFFFKAILPLKAAVSGHNTQVVSLLPIYRYFLPVSLSLVSFTILTNIDVILVKHFFSSLSAGYYSIAQMIGKIFLFLPSSLAIVMFPKSTAAYVKNAQSHTILHKSLVVASVICGIGVFFCFLFPGPILSILTSQANPVSKKLVGLFSLSMSFYALLWIILNFLLATHKVKFSLFLFVISLIETLAIYYCHFRLQTVLYILLIFSVVCFFTIFYVAENTK
ncbi:MAG: oligosaccharide flippase family protein [Candidatus Omnitrophica bacterium]|nr:oligosaccharide flippase family protein [Candidatus Omnitrophota bacterium]